MNFCKNFINKKNTVTLENQDDIINVYINDEIVGDATEVLIALGYSQTEAMKAISQIEVTKDSTAEELVKLALKNLM